MVREFYPWKIDADVEKTEKLYGEKDFSIEKKWNEELINIIGKDARDLLESLGVDLMKIEVEEKVYDFCEDDEVQEVTSITGNFAISGRLIEIPSWQAELYEDDEVLGKLPEVMSKNEAEEISYELGTLKPGIVFKPPYFRVEKGYLRVWDSGYVVGSLLIIK